MFTLSVVSNSILCDDLNVWSNPTCSPYCRSTVGYGGFSNRNVLIKMKSKLRTIYNTFRLRGFVTGMKVENLTDKQQGK